MHVIADIHVRNRAEMDEKLETAMATACNYALADGARGLLVTRHGFGKFSIALSADVPFGLTREQDLVNRK